MKQAVSHHKLTAQKVYFKRISTHFNCYTNAPYVNRMSGERMAFLLKQQCISVSLALCRSRDPSARGSEGKDQLR